MMMRSGHVDRAPRAVLVAGCCVAGAAGFSAVAAGQGDLFEEPVRLKTAEGVYIDTDIGHAAPYVYDFDGDGVDDLLVGQFGEGKLRIYRNAGTNEEPSYEAHSFFKAEHEFGTVPSG